MAVRHVLVKRPREAVWTVLCQGRSYSEWVIGAQDAGDADPAWPDVGASLDYVVRLGPWRLRGQTVVRSCEPPRSLELEALSGWLGTARIAIELRPWGEDTLVIVDEHPLAGPGGVFHNSVMDAVLQLRNRRMLARFAKVVERTTSR